MTAEPKQERRSSEHSHPNEAVIISERFRSEINSSELPALGPDGRGVLTISGGLASFPKDAETAHQLFTQADKALIEAKKGGKNRVYLVGQPNQPNKPVQSD